VAESNVEVAAAAVVHAGRVLAARRVYPADVSGGWELPGGKIDAGETAAAAVAREIREELSCTVEVVDTLTGRAAIKPGYELTVHVARLVDGEPTPNEHDALRWLGPEDIDDIGWLPADRPFLDELRTLLMAGHRMLGGNVGGAVRIGRTVRRDTGPWTDSVHALLAHLRAAGLVEVPRVVGTDKQGREVLTYLPGRVPEMGVAVSEALLTDALQWLRRYHDVVAGFRGDGPWRTVHRSLTDDEIICHHDFAPYNVAVSTFADGERLVGVYDWDLAGPGKPLDDLAFAAWNWVPLHWEAEPETSARRLQVMATAYGGGHGAREILDAVVARIERSILVMTDGAAAGDPGMINLAELGAPGYTKVSLDALRGRVPAIRALL
jgi:8-oxo-dGTP diphosphatase